MMKIINPVKGARLLRYPVGQVYQGYGENIALYFKAIGSAGHNGLDIVAEQGTPILATKGKIVEVKDTPTGYGKHVRIITPPDINGEFYELIFGHLDSINVRMGQKVEDYHWLGGMGNTGFIISGSTPYWGTAPAGKGVHLHFGVRECQFATTGNVVSYPTGDSVMIKNYNNGLFGYINPLKFIDIDYSTAQAAQGVLLSIRMKLLEMLNRLKVAK